MMKRSSKGTYAELVEPALFQAAVRERGFLLDAPPGAAHSRNLPLSWSDGRALFGWEPSAVLEIMEGESGSEALSHLGRLFEALKGGGAAIAVGYLSYDLGGHLEPSAASKRRVDSMPLASFAVYDRYYEYDAGYGTLVVHKANSCREATAAEMETLLRAAHKADDSGLEFATEAKSDFTRREYMEAVAAAREYILAGDIFEVNLSQCFRTQFTGEPRELYRRLRRVSPAPYAAFLQGRDWALLSSSPELFLRVAGGKVTTRPIKGTIARREGAFDEEAVRELAASEKDNAELAMIIDLERNDLGRVCSYGSVRVRERARVETFSSVHHLVSTVEGTLEGEAGLVGLLRATFPGGSITGAPKVRAMQIIDELEPCRRGVYTGAIGYVLPGGRAEFNIAIRTMVASRGQVRLQVGGAVTADSDPAAEYRETLAKAAGMMEALKMAPPGKEDQWATTRVSR